MYDALERSVRGLKDGPTRSRAARRPPTRSRVPWTRQTSPLSGRNQPSMFRIPLAPPRTAGAWSSAPGGESGRTLREEQERKATIIKRRTRSSSTGAVFLSSPLDVCPGSVATTAAAAAWLLGQTLTRRWWLRIFFRGAHRRRLHMLVLTVRWPLMSGESWVPAPTRPDGLSVCFLLCDSPRTIGSCCPTSSRFCHYVTMLEQATPLGNKRNDRVN